MTYDELQAILEEAFPPVAPEHPRFPYMSGDDYHTDKRNDERWAIDMFIDVLSAKGLLHKTTTEWGVSSKDGDRTIYTPATDEEDAQRILSMINQGYPWIGENKIVTRDVSEWRQA